MGLKNEFETAVVNEPSVVESLKFYCILSALQQLKSCSSTSVGNRARSVRTKKGATSTYVATESDRFEHEDSPSDHNGVTPGGANKVQKILFRSSWKIRDRKTPTVSTIC